MPTDQDLDLDGLAAVGSPSNSSPAENTETSLHLSEDFKRRVKREYAKDQ
jgi:hypothetical protein